MRTGAWAVKARAVALLGCLAMIAPTVVRSADAARCFQIFDATAYKFKPDLAEYGIEPAHVIYGIRQLWGNHRVPERLANLPGRFAVQTAVRRAAAGRSAPPLIVLEVEHWPNIGTDMEVAASVEKYVTLAQWAKADAGNGMVSFYGVPPLRDYWRAIGDATTPEYRQWQAENDRFRRVAAAVDAFTPSLYTFYDDANGWKRYAAANVSEARRLAQGKPVYPFIWPQYHNSNRTLNGQYLSADYWTQQLRIMEELADGVVIWAGGPGPWQADAEWWTATRAFIASSNKACRPQSTTQR
jgi:hypothetical protein